MKIECSRPEEVVREAFWLAWQACGHPLGMGIFQDNPGANKQEIWNNVRCAGDYDGGEIMRPSQPGRAKGDYVFGRMMKLSLDWDKTGVSFRDSEPRADYQSWCRRYPTYEALVRAAILAVEGKGAA